MVVMSIEAYERQQGLIDLYIKLAEAYPFFPMPKRFKLYSGRIIRKRRGNELWVK